MKYYLKLIFIIVIEAIICLPSTADDKSLNRVENKVKQWESEGLSMIGIKSHNRTVKKLYNFCEKVKDSNYILLSSSYKSSDKNSSYALLRCRIGAAYQWALSQPHHVYGILDKYGLYTVPYDYMRYREITTSDAVKIIFPYLHEEFAIQKYQNDSLAVEAYYAISNELQERLRIEYEQIAEANWDNYEKLYKEQRKKFEEEIRQYISRDTIQTEKLYKEQREEFEEEIGQYIRQYIAQDTIQTEKAETPVEQE